MPVFGFSLLAIERSMGFLAGDSSCWTSTMEVGRNIWLIYGRLLALKQSTIKSESRVIAQNHDFNDIFLLTHGMQGTNIKANEVK
jgi:hypothetical protein